MLEKRYPNNHQVTMGAIISKGQVRKPQAFLKDIFGRQLKPLLARPSVGKQTYQIVLEAGLKSCMAKEPYLSETIRTKRLSWAKGDWTDDDWAKVVNLMKVTSRQVVPIHL